MSLSLRIAATATALALLTACGPDGQLFPPRPVDTGWNAEDTASADTAGADTWDPTMDGPHDPVMVYVFEGARFSDGGSLEGYFVYDTEVSEVLRFSVCTGATANWSAKTYDISTAWAAWYDYFEAIDFTGFDVVGPYSNSYRILRVRAGEELRHPQLVGTRLPLGDTLECINCAPTRHATGVLVAVEHADAPDPCN